MVRRMGTLLPLSVHSLGDRESGRERKEWANAQRVRDRQTGAWPAGAGRERERERQRPPRSKRASQREPTSWPTEAGRGREGETTAARAGPGGQVEQATQGGRGRERERPPGQDPWS
jgi:hypothetical protein